MAIYTSSVLESLSTLVYCVVSTWYGCTGVVQNQVVDNWLTVIAFWRIGCCCSICEGKKLFLRVKIISGWRSSIVFCLLRGNQEERILGLEWFHRQVNCRTCMAADDLPDQD